MIVITKRPWPNLELRARIVQRRNVRKALSSVVKHVVAAVLAPQAEQPVQPVTPPTLIDVLKDIDESELDELAAHVMECSNCKADLARAARAGAYVPEKLLIAAGIEVLRN